LKIDDFVTIRPTTDCILSDGKVLEFLIEFSGNYKPEELFIELSDTPEKMPLNTRMNLANNIRAHAPQISICFADLPVGKSDKKDWRSGKGNNITFFNKNAGVVRFDASVARFSSVSRIYYRALICKLNNDNISYRLVTPIYKDATDRSDFFLLTKTGKANNITSALKPTVSLSGGKDGWLQIDKNKIIRPKDGEPVWLRGVNFNSAEHRLFFYLEYGVVDINKTTSTAGKPWNLGNFYISTDWWREVMDPQKATWLRAIGLTDAFADELTRWGVNTVRITFNQEWVIKGYKADKLAVAAINDRPFQQYVLPQIPQPSLERGIDSYLADLDIIISMLTKRGIKVILCCHIIKRIFDKSLGKPPSFADVREYILKYESDPEKGIAFLYNAPLPDNNTLLAWRILAGRYKDVPDLFFELFNEPHYLRMNDAYTKKTGDYFSGVDWGDPDKDYEENPWSVNWSNWACALADIITGISPKRILMIQGFGGPCWSASLRSAPYNSLHNITNNIVYTSHLYFLNPDKPYPTGTRKTDDWKFYLKSDDKTEESKKLLLHYPVFITEWAMETKDSGFVNAETAAPNSPPLSPEKDSLELISFLTDPSKALSTKDPVNVPIPKNIGWTSWTIVNTPRMVRREYEHGPFKKYKSNNQALPTVMVNGKVETVPTPLFEFTDYGWVIFKELYRAMREEQLAKQTSAPK